MTSYIIFSAFYITKQKGIGLITSKSYMNGMQLSFGGGGGEIIGLLILFHSVSTWKTKN